VRGETRGPVPDAAHLDNRTYFSPEVEKYLQQRRDAILFGMPTPPSPLLLMRIADRFTAMIPQRYPFPTPLNWLCATRAPA
jgi:hypothetical protein